MTPWHTTALTAALALAVGGGALVWAQLPPSGASQAPATDLLLASPDATEPTAAVAPAKVAMQPLPRPVAAAEGTMSSDELRRLVERDPERALALLDELDRADAAGEQAPDRALLRMRALVHLDQVPAARAAARRFYERFGEHPLAAEVEAYTGVHPRR